MTTSQLPRQLELNLNAVSRSFRQALRFATKHDPEGTEETSPAWKTVAARQAVLLTMLSAISPFLNPVTPQVIPQLPSPPVEEPAVIEEPEVMEAANEAPVFETPASGSAPGFLASLPAEIQAIYHQILDREQQPAATRQQKRQKQRALECMKADLRKRYDKWRAAQRNL